MAHADAKLEDFSVMALGALDGRAVVKSADGKMRVLTVGDALPGTQAAVLQVLVDKFVVEESVGKEGQPKVKQMAGIFKAAQAGLRARCNTSIHRGQRRCGVRLRGIHILVGSLLDWFGMTE